MFPNSSFDPKTVCRTCGVSIGDVILEVNGASIVGQSHADVLLCMGASDAQMTVLVVDRCSPLAYAEVTKLA